MQRGTQARTLRRRTWRPWAESHDSLLNLTTMPSLAVTAEMTREMILYPKLRLWSVYRYYKSCLCLFVFPTSDLSLKSHIKEGNMTSNEINTVSAMRGRGLFPIGRICPFNQRTGTRQVWRTKCRFDDFFMQCTGLLRRREKKRLRCVESSSNKSYAPIVAFVHTEGC